MHEPRIEARLEALKRAHGLGPEAVEALRRWLYELVLDATVAPAADRLPAVGTDEGVELLAVLGRGGMGEVWRARDVPLDRTVALKAIRPDLHGDPSLSSRFVQEARATGQLQHPGIVPVHRLGQLADGRLFFLMEEVRGRRLSKLIDEVHTASRAAGRWTTTSTGWSLRRLVDALLRATEPVSYAHSKGVLHRDFKPDNVMVGAYGEVRVLDWGIAKVLDRDEPPTGTTLSGGHTQAGLAMGTPRYMAPEQARGDTDQLGPWTDVWSIGATLYHVLAGAPPYREGGGRAVALAAAAAHPEPLPEDALPVPDELLQIALRAMAAAPGDRFADAEQLAAGLRSWLEGSRRREVALDLVHTADALRVRLTACRAEAEALRAEATAGLAHLAPHAAAEDKSPLWATEDRARALQDDAGLLEVEYLQLLRTALNQSPDLDDAHARLADWYKREHAAAEGSGDTAGAARAEALLRAHSRGRHDAWLAGEGLLTVGTDPPGARVECYRYVERERRLSADYVGDLGATPVLDAPLPHGSYLLVLHAPGRAPVRYPVRIERQGHWIDVAPGEDQPRAVVLPPLPGDEGCVVPAGWSTLGSRRPVQKHAVPPRRVWLDGFAIQRTAVRNRDYLAFLDALVAAGRDDEALRHAPRIGDRMVYARHGDRFALAPDDDGDLWGADWPVFRIDWFGARAYAAWYAETTGLPWRLPFELEWEKAARGVDSRLFPWGDRFDPTFATSRLSRPGGAYPEEVGSRPVDESPYGVRDLAGNISCWCADPYRPRGPAIDPTGRPIPDVDPAPAHRAVRGGNWSFEELGCRADWRQLMGPEARTDLLGVRLVRSLE